MNKAEISIVILNYNGYKDTLECLASILKMNYRNIKIVIVDNGSKNDSIKQINLWLAKEKIDPMNVYIITTGENIGFARGNNIGIRHVLENNRSEYILILNNDTVV